MPPALVAFPRDADEVVAVVETCLELGVPLTARGAGTSIAGNAVGTGVVMDLARHLGRVRSLDPEAAPPGSSRASSSTTSRPPPGPTGCASAPTRRPTAAAPSAA